MQRQKLKLTRRMRGLTTSPSLASANYSDYVDYSKYVNYLNNMIMLINLKLEYSKKHWKQSTYPCARFFYLYVVNAILIIDAYRH